MSVFRCVAAVSLFMVLTALGRADEASKADGAATPPPRVDGLPYNFPKDGAWATYDVDGAVKMDGHDAAMKATLRIASVGQATEENQPCRWIEVQFDGGVAMEFGRISEVHKFLIPEKFLAKGESPLDHVLRGWHLGRFMDKPKKVDLAAPEDSFDNYMLPFMWGPWKDVKPLEKAEVESKLGNLACKGIQAIGEIKLRGKSRAKYNVTNRLHDKSPFGLVAGHWAVKLPEKSSAEWDVKLVDVGENAVSKMPDAK